MKKEGGTMCPVDKDGVEYVRIPKESYLELKKNEAKLDALIAAGVDNWDGYDYAMEILDEFEDEEVE